MYNFTLKCKTIKQLILVKETISIFCIRVGKNKNYTSVITRLQLWGFIFKSFPYELAKTAQQLQDIILKSVSYWLAWHVPAKTTPLKLL